MIRAAALVALLAPSMALATAGYFQLGYGLKSKALGGAGVAFPEDSLAAASNPAGMAWVGNRLDLGLDWFHARRGSRISNNTEGLNGERDASDPAGFPVPEAGYNRVLGEGRSIGVSVYGNGGMTRYAANPLAGLGDGTSPAGLEFIQGVVAPSFALKTGPGSSIGVAVNLVYQELEARGFEHFDSPAFSVAPGHVTNRGRDHSLGVGLRVGWLAHVLPSLTLGAAYQPRIRMSKFERYKGLLADGGNFDVPENYTVGAALSLMPGLTGLIDIQRIQFGGVRSFGNRADCFLATTCLLGTKEGPGSGWRNTTVYKLGLAYDWSSRLTLRGGLSFLRQPIPPSQTFLNVFAPAVAEKHFSLGATWTVRPDLELTAAYMHGFENRVQGRNSIPPGPPGVGAGGGEADIHMKQRALGIAVGWRM